MASTKGEAQLKTIAKQLDDLTLEFGMEFLKRVRNYTPVRSGLLQQSWVITFDTQAKEIQLTNTATDPYGVQYAGFVESGTPHFAGAFMVAKASMEADQILDVAKRKIGLA